MLKQSVLSPRSAAIFCAITLLTFALCAPVSTRAQDADDSAAERQRAFQLYSQSKFAEALPLFEKLAITDPSDAEVMEYFGFVVFNSSAQLKDKDARKQARARARKILLQAQELGADDALLKSTLASIAPDGGDDAVFSTRKEVNEAMQEGEAAFALGNFDKALAAYTRALRLDPNQYEAALFTGDVYYKSNQQDKAGEWFAKAIAIDPNRETAYRYWGDSLMKQNKMKEALDKLVEAFVAEPYNRLARAGLIGWARHYQVRLSDPEIVIPIKVTPGNSGGTTTIALPDKLNTEDGSASWTLYAITRATWTSKKFSQTFPKEKTYRHSLPEEAEALRLVAETAAADLKSKKIKMLEPSLANLAMLNDAGLLEAYILLARADEGIAQDYAKYRKANRDKLRRYMLEQVVHLSPNK